MVPFTSAQWKELERQAMIYKYMISSVPVPPHLLHSSLSSAAGVEIGRCKRTDGKKWRCSRDVAPHQKYCERHLHRGRPRSRKPVEQQQQQQQQVYTNIKNDNNGDDDENHKKPRLQQFAADDEQSLMLFNSKTGFDTNVSTHHGNRELDSTMDNEMFACHEASQKWHNLLETNMGFTNEESSIYGSNEIFHQDYNVDQQPLDHVSSYSYFRSSDIDAPTGFVDLNNTNDNLNTDYSLSTNYENFCPWLNLSISGYGETGNGQMRNGVDSYNEDSNCLETFGPGGPLAEALGGNSTSPHGSTSGPATAVSSPSGVLPRTLFSYSEGSVCNSPLEIGLQWIMK